MGVARVARVAVIYRVARVARVAKKNGGKNMSELIEVTGYLSGSKMRKIDTENHTEDKDVFIDSMLNEVIRQGGEPIYETYRIFNLNGGIYGTILVNTELISDNELNVPILNLEEE